MIRRFDSLKESDNRRKLMRHNIRNSSLRESEDDEDIDLVADAVDSDVEEDTVTVELTQSELKTLQKILDQADIEDSDEDLEDEDEDLEDEDSDEDLEESKINFQRNRIREARIRALAARRRQQRIREARNKILSNRSRRSI